MARFLRSDATLAGQERGKEWEYRIIAANKVDRAPATETVAVGLLQSRGTQDMAHLKPECAKVQDIVSAQFKRLDKVRILEAGSGSNSAFDFAANRYLVGLDIDQRQLQRNETLDEKHQGDLQSYTFSPESFDMIVCWNVLEHLSEPEKALDNFADWLAPGGIVILALPNVRSTIGLATKYTPYWFHIWWYRHVLHVADAGKDGRGPFRTFLRSCLSQPRLKQFAEERGLALVFLKTYGIRTWKSKAHAARSLVKVLSFPLEIISLRRISAFRESIMVVFEK